MAKGKKAASAVGLFFRSFLKGMVVLLGIAVIGLGVYLGILIYNGNGKKTEASAPDEAVFTDGKVDPLLTAEPTEAATESIYVTEFTNIDFGVGINVINATDTSGLAGYWRDKLNEIGYTKVFTCDSSSPMEKTKIVITEDGIASELKEVFPKASWETRKVSEEEMNGDIEGINVYIFIGNDYDEMPREEE